MSGLAGLLVGDHPPGVYTWHAAFDPADVRRTVEHAGADFAYVDGWTHQTKAEFLSAAGVALGFPEWYGANLDAFADCLGDLLGNPVVLLWDGWAPLARSDPGAFSAILEIAAERAAVAGPPFSLLLRGVGPTVDLPALDS